jgi:hypothetical protein
MREMNFDAVCLPEFDAAFCNCGGGGGGDGPGGGGGRSGGGGGRSRGGGNSYTVTGTSKSGGFPGGKSQSLSSVSMNDTLCGASRAAIVGGAAGTQLANDPRGKAASAALAGLGAVGQNMFCD